VTSTAAVLPETAEVSLLIGGMTCGACAARIEKRLNLLEGVEARVNYASERATATFPVDVPVERLIAEVEAAGYRAELPSQDAGPSVSATEDIDGRVRSLRRRLFVSALLFMPLCDTSIAFSVSPNLRFPGWQWLMIALAAPVVTWAAWPFYQAAVRSARHGVSTMDTLVSLGIVASTVWSLYAMFWRDTSRVPQSILFMLVHRSAGAIYLDVAAGVTTFVLAGRYFEAWSRQRSGNALRALAAVGAKDVAVIDQMGFERRRPVAALGVGDRFIVRPGETVATDGEVVFGQSAVDRSLLTGESQPLDVTVGDLVVGGTVSTNGRLVVRATKVGRDTQLAQMLRLVEHAQNEKAAVQRLADRVCNVFVPAVLLIALVTLAAWVLLHRRLGGSGHRLSVRPRPGHAGGPVRGDGRGRPSRDLLQGVPRPRGVQGDRHGRVGQDRHPDQGDDEGDRHRGRARWGRPHALALGRCPRAGVGTSGRVGHRGPCG